MPTLTGYRMPVAMALLEKFADHTYVGSSEGHSWGCWGRSKGGEAICSGDGDPAIANCLSRTRSGAGITYGITGLCHQTANRILAPAGITVHEADGYGLSLALFGTYGFHLDSIMRYSAGSELRFGGEVAALGEWVARQLACGLKPAERRYTFEKASEEEYFNRITEHHNRILRSGEAESGDEREATRFVAEELAVFAGLRLGRQLERSQVVSIVDVNKDVHQEKTTIVKSFDSGVLRGRGLADEVNEVGNNILAEAQRVLGADDFQAVFGVKPGERLNIVDPEIAESVYG